MAINLSNGNPLSNAVNRARRLQVVNHIWAQDVVIYRKVSTRPDEDNDPNNERTIGGALELGIDDTPNFEFDTIGAAKMLLTAQHGGSSHAGEWQTFNTDAGDVPALIEPVIEGEFVVEKHDRVYVILPNFFYAYQVVAVVSPSSLPQGRSTVYMLQPLEQPANVDFNNLY